MELDKVYVIVKFINNIKQLIDDDIFKLYLEK